jgi:hypothetical protein
MKSHRLIAKVLRLYLIISVKLHINLMSGLAIILVFFS